MIHLLLRTILAIGQALWEWTIHLKMELFAACEAKREEKKLRDSG
jgi:hypothetical protein